MKNAHGWLDRPGNITRLVQVLYALCAALFFADLLYEKQVHFAFERWLGFYAGFGFLAYLGIVTAGKLLRRLVRRPEEYYEQGRRDG